MKHFYIYRAVFFLAFLSFALVSCNSLKFDAAVNRSIAEVEWRTEGGSNARTYFKPNKLQFPLKEVAHWNAQAGFGRDPLRTIGVNVVLATMKGEVYAWDMRTRKKLGFVQLGESIDGGFVVYNNLLIVPHANGKRSLSAFDFEKGAKSWITKGESVSGGLLLSVDRVIYADTKGNVVAVRAESGEVIWKSRIREEFTAILASPVSDGKNLFVIDQTGRLGIFDLQHGTKLGEVNLQLPVENTPVWDRSTERLYVSTTRGEMLVVKPLLRQIEKRFEIQESDVRLATPALAQDMLVVGSSNGDVSGVNKESGAIHWQLHTDGGFVAPPLIVSNVALIGGLDKILYALDIKEGNVVWDTTLKGRIKSVPMVQDGYLFVLSEPNLLYVFKPQEGGNVQ